jgi:cell division protein FtsB
MVRKRGGVLARRWVTRALWGAVAVGAVAFAVNGGEFSVLDMRRRRVEAAELSAKLTAARFTIDSLRAYRDSVTRHPLVIERIGREQYGLVRSDREVVYWAPAADSTGGGQ